MAIHLRPFLKPPRPRMATKRCPSPPTSCRGSMTFSCLLVTASGASSLPPLAAAFHYIGNQQFRFMVKAGLATYFYAATDAARSLLQSTVEEDAAAASAEQRLAGGGRPGHYFGAAIVVARSLLWSMLEDIAKTASVKQGLAVWVVIGGVEGNVPRGRFRVPSPAYGHVDPSSSKDAAAGTRHGLCRAGRGRGMWQCCAALVGSRIPSVSLDGATIPSARRS